MGLIGVGSVPRVGIGHGGKSTRFFWSAKPARPKDVWCGSRRELAGNFQWSSRQGLYSSRTEGGPATGRGRGLPGWRRQRGPHRPAAGRAGRGDACRHRGGRGAFDTAAMTELWDAALSAPGWDRPSVWFHGDFHTGNLLTVDGRLSAVIDFGGLGIGDPACDLTIAFTLMSAGPRAAFRAALGVNDATWTRGRGWALATGP
ncbi:phosphotransferase [Streptomyces sp. NBC_01275]|uniref:phosphotransferase n=1 Tax=Streptomyces sp. NBC_01275 TaxID=2903807 RepID=UPI00224DAFE1|nr:phosphotransferase [Streptomyces sp. NBC_01275]MCX4767863.1 phosphotransferase [Streptomyces sp. NBC_01275]